MAHGKTLGYGYNTKGLDNPEPSFLLRRAAVSVPAAV